jgi:hypothetical protein
MATDETQIENQKGKQMKPNKWTIGIIAAGIVIVASAVKAQETNSETPPPNFFQTAGGYLTSNNTNFTWVGNKFEMEAGADYQNGLQEANDLTLGYNINDSWQIRASMLNAGIAGVVEGLEGGVGFSVINSYAIKAEAYGDLGYSREWNSGYGRLGLELKKKLTPNTYAFIGLDEPIYFRRAVPNEWAPEVRAGAGFTY